MQRDMGDQKPSNEITHNGGLMSVAKPFVAVVLLQIGFAGMDILSMVALKQGMSNYVLVVYRHAIATVVIAPFAFFLDKKVRPKMTAAIFTKLMLLSFLEPVIDQNLYYMGMKQTSATFAATMCNVLPAITFLMAWILRLEEMSFRSIYSQSKVGGTLTTVAGAMLMTLMRGPVIELFWTNGASNSPLEHGGLDRIGGISLHDSIKGSLMITTGCFSWASFIILQAITLRTYPAELSLTAWICLLGTAQGTIVALVMERGRAFVWSIGWDSRLLAAAYSGIVCSGMAYYVQGVIMKERGPVFVTAFNPLCMVIVAAISCFFLGEQLYLGRAIGAMVIAVGLYMVVWGKSKDRKPSLPSIEDGEMKKTKQMTWENDKDDRENPAPKGDQQTVNGDDQRIAAS